MNWVDHFRLARTEREMTEKWSQIFDTKANRFTNWFNTWLVRGGRTPLDYEIDFTFLGPFDYFDFSPSKLSPLQLAFTFGHDVIARQLLEKNDKVHSQYLILAAHSGNVSAIRILLDKGVSVETRSSYYYTPLMEAALTDKPLAVQELLNAGAQMDATNSSGKTALMIATSMGHSEVVEVLLEANGKE